MSRKQLYILELQNVIKRFGDFTAVRNLSFNISPGEYVAIVGPSGSGKTTLLLMLGGFEQPDSGHILINGKDVGDLPPELRNTSTVFQEYALFPHMTVLSNIEFGLKMRKIDKEKRRRMALEILELVGLKGLGNRRPHELSGGQRQRVALARSLVVKPDIILLDEPLGALDAAMRRQMQRELKSIQKKVGITFLHITHDQEEAMHVGDRLIIMHDGVVQDNGTPERIYHRPSTRFAAEFMGDNNILEGVVSALDGPKVGIDSAIGKLRINAPETISSSLAVGSPAVLAVRPEDLRIVGNTNAVENVIADVTIKEINFIGFVIMFITEHLAVGELRIRLHSAHAPDFSIGQKIALTFNPEDAFFLQEGAGSGSDE